MPDPFELDAEPPATVTAVRPLPSNSERCTVLVGRRAVARLRTVDAETIGLRPDLPWTDALAAAVAAAVTRDRVRREALRLLRHRAMATATLRRRLVDRDHAEIDITAVLDELAAAGWLDDEQLAFDTAARRHARRPGPAPALAQRLEAHEIDTDLAERAAAAAVGDADPVELALDVARRLRGAARASASDRARRVAGTLARRGFDEDTVRTVLHRLDLLDAIEGGID